MADSLAPRIRDTNTRAASPGEPTANEPSATPWPMISAKSGVRCPAEPVRSFSRTIAFSSDSQTRMTARSRSRRASFQAAIPANAPLSLSVAVMSGSATRGSSDAVAWTIIRSRTASRRSVFESK